LRGSKKPEAKPETAAPAAAAPPAVVAPPPPPAAPPPAAPTTAEAPPAPAEAAEAKPSARVHRHRTASDDAKVDPAHRQIPLPAEDTTPAELKNPFHTP
jgi:hypothetical protein